MRLLQKIPLVILMTCLLVISILPVTGDFAPQVASAKFDETPRIALMSAFADEQALFRERIENAQVYTINGFEFMTGTLAAQDVVLVIGGVSMVNAAMNAQLVLERFTITHIIFSGIGGGIDYNINPGDVVVPQQWAQYQESIYAYSSDGMTFQLPNNFIPAVNPFQMMQPKPVQARSAESPDGRDVLWFEVDAVMYQRAEAITSRFSITECINTQTCLIGFAPVKVGGNGLSGQAYVNNQDYRAYLIDEFHAQVIDMESAAVAQVAYSNGVPFIAFRGISDIAGVTVNPPAQVAGEAALNVQNVVLAYLETLGGDS